MTKIGYTVLKEMTYKGHSIKVVDRLNQELVYIDNNEEETFFSVADAKRVIRGEQPLFVENK